MVGAQRTKRGRNLLVALIVTDFHNIARDALLAVIIVAPILVALIFRAFVPDVDQLQDALEAYLTPATAERLAVAAPLLFMSSLMAIAPGLVGAVYGLLLVDERDDRTLTVLRVMPTPFSRYLLARLVLPSALATLMSIVAYPLAGLAPLPMSVVIALAITGATSVPVVTLAMVAFSPNKVAALAVMRVANTVLALPLLAYFATPPMLYLAWPVPSFWQMKALWLAADGAPFVGALALSVAINAALCWLFYRFFMQRAEA